MPELDIARIIELKVYRFSHLPTDFFNILNHYTEHNGAMAMSAQQSPVMGVSHVLYPVPLVEKHWKPGVIDRLQLLPSPGETRWDKESHVGEGLTKLHPTLHNLQVHEPRDLKHNWTEWSLRSTVIQVEYPLRMGWGQACAPRILCISSWVALQCTLLWLRHALCLFIIYLYMFMLFPLKLRATGLAGKHSANNPQSTTS